MDVSTIEHLDEPIGDLLLDMDKAKSAQIAGAMLVTAEQVAEKGIRPSRACIYRSLDGRYQKAKRKEPRPL